jgi:hypothetical protein
MGGCAPFVSGRGEHVQAARMREAEVHCLDPLCELGLCLHLPWCGADILVGENRWGVGVERSIGARRSGEEVFGHG